MIQKTMKRHWKLLVACILICMLLLWMYVALFPTIKEQSEEMTELFASYPDAFLEAFGLESEAIGTIFNNLESFLNVEHYSLIWPLVMIILAISLGSSAIAGEVDGNTIEFLLSQPLSRLKVFISKYLGGLAVIIAFVLLSVFSIVPIAGLYGIDVAIENHLVIAGLGLLFGVAIYTVAMFFSALFSTKGSVAFTVAGLMIAMYAANIAASMQESIEWVRYLSAFYYYDYHEALIEGTISGTSILVFVGVILVFLPLGMIVFQKRDISM